MFKKTIIFAFAAIALTLAIPSCKKSEKVVPLAILTADKEFGVMGGTGTITFESSRDVTLTSDSPWLKATLAETTINLTVEPNLTTGGRYGTLTVKTEAEQQTVSIFQEGITFATNLESFQVNNEGETKTYTVQSNVPVEFTSSADWLTFEWKGDDFSVTAAENAEGKLRIGKISWAYGDVSGEIKVTQYGLASLIGEYKFTRTINGKVFTGYNQSTSYDNQTVEGTLTINANNMTLPLGDGIAEVTVATTISDEEGVFIVKANASQIQNGTVVTMLNGITLRFKEITDTSLVLEGEDVAVQFLFRPSGQMFPMGNAKISNIRCEMPLEQ